MQAHDRAEPREVPPRRPVPAAVVAAPERPVLLDDVEVPRVQPHGVEPTLVHRQGVLRGHLRREDAAGETLPESSDEDAAMATGAIECHWRAETGN